MRFLLKMLGDPGEIVRAQLRKEKQLKPKVRTGIDKAFDTVEITSLSAQVARIEKSAYLYGVHAQTADHGVAKARVTSSECQMSGLGAACERESLKPEIRRRPQTNCRGRRINVRVLALATKSPWLTVAFRRCI